MIRYALVLVFSLAFSATAFAQERMGAIPAEKMTDSQKKAAADHIAARGQLTGPWSVLVRSPELMGRVRGLSDYVRFNSALPPRLSEFVILITARQWSQAYEWNAHYARAAGKFGERALLDSIGLMGHYSLIGMVLNTARTPVEPGGPALLERFPR